MVWEHCTVLYCTVLYCTVLYSTVVIKVYTGTILPTMPEVGEDDENDPEEADSYNGAIDKYLTYFEATWLGATNKRTNVR